MKTEKQHTTLRGTVKTLIKSTGWYIPVNKESSSELNMKIPGTPQKTTKTDNHRIFSLVKKIPLHVNRSQKYPEEGKAIIIIYNQEMLP